MLINIVIGEPIVNIKELYGDEEIGLFTEERFLPNILVKLGIFPSNSQVRKNRPDLFTTLDKLDFMEVKIGKHRLWITVGE